MSSIEVGIHTIGGMYIATAKIDGYEKNDFMIMERSDDDMVSSITRMIPLFYKEKERYVRVSKIIWEDNGLTVDIEEVGRA